MGEVRREGFEEKGMGGGRREVRGVKGESDGERGEGRRAEKGIGKGMEERDREEKETERRKERVERDTRDGERIEWDGTRPERRGREGKDG